MLGQPSAVAERVYSTVGIGRDPDFVHRGNVLDRVRDTCLTHAERAVLSGPNGVGKTSLALEFAHTLLQENKISVFWIDASSPERYQASVEAIADNCKIPLRPTRYSRLTQVLRGWLEEYGQGDEVKWCIILDGADDYEFLFNQKEDNQLLHVCLVGNGNGCILTTTTDERVAAEMSTVEAKIQNIGPMAEKEALVLWQAKSNALSESDTWKMAGEVIRKLEFNPKAIAQAALDRRLNPDTDFAQFISPRNLRGIATAQPSEAQLPEKDWTEDTTWDAAIDRLEQTRPTAASLLYLMSLFGDGPIPAWVLQIEGVRREPEAHFLSVEASNQPQESLWAQTDFKHTDSLGIKFERDSQTLLDYFLITGNQEKNTFGMHTLVQEVARKRLADKSETERYSKEYIARLARVLPTPEYVHFERTRQLWPHFVRVLDYPQRDNPSKLQRSTVLHNGSFLTMAVGEFDHGLKLIEEAIPARRDLLGEDHDLTLKSLNFHAMMLCYTKQTPEALDVQEKTLERSVAAFGEDHDVVIEGNYHLVPIFWNLNRAKEAMDVMDDVVEKRKRITGDEADETLGCIGLQAHIYWVVSWLQKAENLATELIETRKRLSGANHPGTLSIAVTLGCVYCDQKRYEEAEKLLAATVEGMKRVLGETHPDTLCAVVSLALVQWHLGQRDLAKEVQDSVLKTLQVHGSISYEQSYAAFNKLLKEQARDDDLVRVKKQLYDIRALVVQAIGRESWEYLFGLEILIDVLKQNGELELADSYAADGLAICTELGGENLPNTMTWMDQHARTRHALGRTEEAITLMRDCGERRQRILGPEHDDTTSSMEALREWEQQEKSERSKRRWSWMRKLKKSA